MRAILVAALALALVACEDKGAKGAEESPDESGGPGAGKQTAEPSAKKPSAPAFAATGLWKGSLVSDSGRKRRVIGIVTAGGEARFVSSGDVQVLGTLAGDAGKVSGTLRGIDARGRAEPITVDGEVEAGASFKGTYKAASGNGTFDLEFLPAYREPAEQSKVAGVWRGAAGFVATIDDKGGITGKNALCKHSGKALARAGVNVYDVELDITDCKPFAGRYVGHASLVDGRLVFGIAGSKYQASGRLKRKK